MQETVDLSQLETKFSELTRKLGAIQGETAFIRSELTQVERNLENLSTDRTNHESAVELLTAVQTVSRDKIKIGFESLITHALQFIFEQPYTFELDFGQRGNLQELNFNIKKPNFTEGYDILETNGGGVIDLISLTLRIVLMELSTPKIEGFLLLDESLKMLSEEYLPKASEFLKEIQQKLKRQVLFISHEKTFTESGYNIIEIK